MVLLSFALHGHCCRFRSWKLIKSIVVASTCLFISIAGLGRFPLYYSWTESCLSFFLLRFRAWWKSWRIWTWLAMSASCAVMIMLLNTFSVNLNHLIIRLNRSCKKVAPSNLCWSVFFAVTLTCHISSFLSQGWSIVNVYAITSRAIQHLNPFYITLLIESICCFVKLCLNLPVDGRYIKQFSRCSRCNWCLTHQTTDPKGLLESLYPIVGII